MGWVAAGILGVSALTLVFWARDRARVRRLYRTKVGLDLAGLVALLPEELRLKQFTHFLLGPLSEHRLTVGLVYPTAAKFVGTPPNVGLEFSPETGALLAIRPEGVGLGLK